jgi:sugar phosphate isomerase/epimerase
MTVELGLTPDGRWDIDVAGLAAAASAAGFSALGLRADLAGPEARTELAGAGLRCHELLALVVGEDAPGTIENAERLARAAAEVGAEWVLSVYLTGVSDRTTKLVERCAAILAEAGTALAVEFSPLGPVATLRDALDLVAAAGAGRAGVIIDSWHFCTGTERWDALARVPLELVAYVQFADASAPTSDNAMRESMHGRAFPGEGVLELDRFASTLLDRGFDGLVSVEVLSRELRALPVPEFARRAHDTTAPYWDGGQRSGQPI